MTEDLTTGAHVQERAAPFWQRAWFQVALLLGVALLIWLPRAFGLQRFVATDEVPWLVRSANFYYALGQRDFASTYQSEHPGVVTMWVETAAYLLDFPQYRSFGQGYFHSDKYWQYERFLLSKGIRPHDLLVTSRTLMVIFNTLLLAGAFLFARLLFGAWPALVGFVLIAFDPFHAFITRLAHLDGPLGSLLLLSLLAFLVATSASRLAANSGEQHERFASSGKRRTFFLLVSAAAGGLAWLAKLPGLLIAPTVWLIGLLDFLCARFLVKSETGAAGSLLARTFKPLLLWTAAFLVTVLVFFPVAWNDPLGTLRELSFSPLTAGRVIPTVRIEGQLFPAESAADISTGTAVAAPLSRNLQYLSRPLGDYLRYPRRYLWHASPVVLLGLLAAFLAFIFRWNPFSDERTRRAVIGLLIFVLVYTVFVTLARKTSEKYYLPVYPVMDLIAGLGWFALVGLLAKAAPFARLKFFAPLALLLVVTFQLAGMMGTYPYYSTYFNPMLVGARVADKELVIGSGEGLDQAAAYLNGKPDAQNLTALSWYGIGPFSYYFAGETLSLFSYVWGQEKISELAQADYLVLYSHQWHLGRPVGLMERLAGTQPEHAVWIDGIEFVRIYNISDLPPVIFEPYVP